MLNNYTILVAEDEEYNYILVKYILQKEGMDVLWARNGEEAVRLFRDNSNIDLVMMDIKMPVMNGLDATKEIKKIKPEIPIIAVTAYALSEDREICLSSGCDEFITKPINRNQLEILTNKLLKRL